MKRHEEKPMQSIRIDAEAYQLLSRAAAADTRTLAGEFFVIVREYISDQLDMEEATEPEAETF